MNLSAPDEHQLLVFWTQLLVLLLVARTLGQAMRPASTIARAGHTVEEGLASCDATVVAVATPSSA